MRPRRGYGRHDRGAAAVEFALVVPLLLLLVFGIIDYGRFFFDSVSLRQGAREGARQAVVLKYGSCTGPSVGAKIACSARLASDITMGTPLVYIPALPVAPVTTPVTPNWAQGAQLLVCMQSKEVGTQFVPFPADGILKTKTYMSIEVDTAPVDIDPTYSSDDAAVAAIGSNWSWCVP